MKNTERFFAALNFERTDRLPAIEWASWWPDTIHRWWSEGVNVLGLHLCFAIEGFLILLNLFLHMRIHCPNIQDYYQFFQDF